MAALSRNNLLSNNKKIVSGFNNKPYWPYY